MKFTLLILTLVMLASCATAPQAPDKIDEIFNEIADSMKAKPASR